MQNEKFSFVVKRYPTRAAMGAAAAEEAAEVIRELLAKKDEINMIFAAAPSQNEFLEALVKAPGIDFTRINAYHMDEYVGLDDDAPQRFGNFLKDHIFGLAPFKSVNYIQGNAEDIDAECERYSKLLRDNPTDIVCMGIGENGHIAFNDPHVADLKDPVLVKKVSLDEVCRMQQVHDGCFASLDLVPKYALTLTVPALVNADYHFCIVPAASKANAVRETVYGPIGEKCPATSLRTCEHAVLYVDQDSGAQL
ncbi:MAG: glucosamine-6-phosphate deaminase [Clostridia bacterium]|nr:glucosamine-6-phosphate deaminase [Clostridia bacterium]